MKQAGNKGFTLVELLVVMAIMIILAAVAVKSYQGYVEKANVAELYEKGRLIRQAFAVYELEDTGGEGWRNNDPDMYNIMMRPNHKKSIIYPYVGEATRDCIAFEIKMRRNAGGKYNITGFEYETETHRLIWKDPDEIRVIRRKK